MHIRAVELHVVSTGITAPFKSMRKHNWTHLPIFTTQRHTKRQIDRKILLKWIWKEQVVKMWNGVMWVSRKNQRFVGCRIHLNHDPRSINLGKLSISWVTSSFSQRCTVATKSKVLKSGVTEVYQLLHSSPQRLRIPPFPPVLRKHVTTPQTVKQSSAKYGIQEIP
jgi:hypothetical protein